MKTLKKNHGLSLIEILIAMVIVAILASIPIRIVSHMDNQSNERSIKSTFAILDGALSEYYDYWESFPDPNKVPYTTDSAALYGQLNSTPGASDFLKNINEKLIKENSNSNVVDMPELIDPWGTLLRYQYLPTYSFPKIISAGPDKVFGTADDILNK